MNPLRPLGLGELIDRSVNFWRANWKALFQLMLGFQLVEGTVLALSQGLVRVLFPLARDPDAINHRPLEALPQLMGSMGLFTVAILGMLLVAQVAGVAATHFTFSRLTARGQPDGAEGFRHAASRLGTTTLTFLLSMGWSFVVMIGLMLPAFGLGAGAVALQLTNHELAARVLLVLAAIAALVSTIVLVLWFAIRFILVSQIIAIEPLGAMATFRRANALSSGRLAQGFGGLVKVRLTILVTIVGLLLLIMSLVITVPQLLAGAAFGATLAPGHTINDVVPLYVLLPLQLLQSILGALLAPLYVVFQTFFYTDMRVRREGLDLELALGT